jgi:hypothetical protein
MTAGRPYPSTNIRATVVTIGTTVADTKLAAGDEPGGYPEKGALSCDFRRILKLDLEW